MSKYLLLPRSIGPTPDEISLISNVAANGIEGSIHGCRHIYARV